MSLFKSDLKKEKQGLNDWREKTKYSYFVQIQDIGVCVFLKMHSFVISAAACRDSNNKMSGFSSQPQSRRQNICWQRLESTNDTDWINSLKSTILLQSETRTLRRGWGASWHVCIRTTPFGPAQLMHVTFSLFIILFTNSDIWYTLSISKGSTFLL